MFLGSGLLFLGMMFVAAATLGALIVTYSGHPEARLGSTTFAFARAFTFDIMNVYAFKMAAVFMIVVSTLAIRTQFIARWIAFLGYGCAAFLLFGSGFFDWAPFVFPCWVLVVSADILIDNLGGASRIPGKTVPGDFDPDQ